MQAGYPEVVSSEIGRIRESTVSAYPEDNKVACDNASAPRPAESKTPCMLETSRARTERPPLRKYSGVTACGLALDFAGFHVQRGVERKRSMRIISKSMAFGSA